MRPLTTLFVALAVLLADAPAGAQETRAGALTITAAWSRATAPAARAGGGFLTIANAGPADDRLIAAATDAAARVELHRTVMEDGVMRMVEQEDGIPIPAGESVKLQPGGLHLMLMGLERPLVEGGRLVVTLTFERAGMVEVELPVGPAGAAMPPMTTHGGGHGN